MESRCSKQKPLAKDNLLFFITLTLWTYCLLYFNPRLLILLIGPENLFAKFCVILFVICLDIFWFYTIFHIVIVTFSYFYKLKSHPSGVPPTIHPAIAILYVTYNDFQVEAASTCLNQDYNNFHVFILDDSISSEYRIRIDEFAKGRESKLTVIRRANRNGFKAGNLNNVLKLIADKYEYFTIADSDSRLPSNFIRNMLPYFSSNDRIGFAQAMHRVNPAQNTYFAKAMGFNLDLHYRHYLLPKERYGFIMFYGHGALIRTDAWKTIGGFPEMVSEDLAFSTKLRRYGYEGILAKDVVCYEDFPQTYRQYRRRTEKWIKGTLEFLFKEYPLFLKAKGISWFEKLDVFACGLSLALGLPFLLFLLIGSFALPVYFSDFRFHGPVFIMPIPEGKTAVSMLTGLRYNAYWTYDFYIMMLITIFYPLIPVFWDLKKNPLKMLWYMSVSTCLFLSTLVMVSLHTLSYLVWKRADFLVTAHEKARLVDRNNRLLLIVEVVFACAFIAIMIASRNLWLISVSVGLFLSPFLFFWDLEKPVLRYLSFLPFLFSLVLLALIGGSIIK